MLARRLIGFLCAAVLLIHTPADGQNEVKKTAPPAKADGTQNKKDANAVLKNRHALLVGVTFYENLPESKHLKGPANDVVLLRKILLDKFHFSPDQITTLSEKEGKDRGKEYLPTRANIEREFTRLTDVVKPGDQVMIVMGGHGSQQPEKPGSPDPEPDGLDELFLPRDVGAWNGGLGTVKNAIIDDDLGDWLKKLQKREVFIWLTMDSCHSGTMTRGGDDKEVTRDLDMTDDLGIPKPAIEKAVKAAEERERAKPEKSRGGPPPAPIKIGKKSGIVAIYAAQPTEVTLEREMPPRTEGAQVYGLLSYTLCQVLTEATEKSKQGITYAELARRVQAQYIAWGRTFPTPLIEGENDDRDRAVLGDTVYPGRSSMQMSPSRNSVKINAGAIHGLTPDSILSVQPPPGQGEELLGYVKLTEVRPFESDGVPCDKDGKTIKKEFPEGGVCQIHFLDAGDQRLRVAADVVDSTGKAMADDLRKRITDALKKVAESNPLVQVVDKPSQADWMVRRWDGKKEDVVLVPGSGWSVGRDASASEAYGPARVDDSLHLWLSQNLTGIARAEAVKKLAATYATGDNSGVKLKVELFRFRGKDNRKNPIPFQWPAPEITVYDKEYLGFRLSNPGRTAIDVTMLYVDSDYGISSVYPFKGEINRLGPNDTLMIPSTSQQHFGINTKTTGREQLIVIAVKAQGQPIDFSALQQESLTRAVPRGDVEDKIKDKRLGKREQQSPLGRLLNSGITGAATSRGLTVTEEGEHAMVIVPFRVTPGQRVDTKSDKKE